MLALLLMLVPQVAYATDPPKVDPPKTEGIKIPNPCPKCLGVLDFDAVIAPPKWLTDTKDDLAPFDLRSLVVYVDVYQGSIEVAVDGVVLGEKNFVGYHERTLVYQISVPSTEEFKVTVQNVGERDAGYDVEVVGSPLDTDR